jgi:protein XagA
MGGWPAFVDVQFAQRFRMGEPPNEFRADLTLGLQPQERWLLLIQSFNVISEGAGSFSTPSYSYSKIQLSAVYALTHSLSLQFGGYTTYMGRNALQENGLVLSAWYRF